MTLFMDLTVVAQALFGQSDDDLSKARSSRTARIGAKVGRVVRVLRLIRIVKLYKAVQHDKAKKAKKQRKMSLHDDMDDEPEDDDKAEENKESLVGQKLSAKTTQRTIILVLTMLMILPVLRMDQAERLPASGTYAAEDMREAFTNFETGLVHHSLYDEAVLKALYYHNWFNGKSGECPGSEQGGCSASFSSNAFWVGIAGRRSDAFLTEVALNASLMPAMVRSWNTYASVQNDLFNFGSMPTEAVETLASPWTTKCSVSGVTHVGRSVLSKKIDGTVDHPVDCPGDLRFMEVDRFLPRLMTAEQYQDWYFVIYFDLRSFTRQEAQMSLCTTVFVCFVLCIASIFFSRDAQALVLEPVEQMISRVEAIRDNPLAAMKMADDEFQREEQRKRARLAKDQTRWGKFMNMCRHERPRLSSLVVVL
ncbi:unnamed protein product [Polarella glacialis]|uniref:Uncharacterized protein n=1 Tax=Polarella glacialis TaxID=89957 RepID=A0A813FG84_POLGL|nr:unnamed protein product [Polarella glacialis]